MNLCCAAVEWERYTLNGVKAFSLTHSSSQGHNLGLTSGWCVKLLDSGANLFLFALCDSFSLSFSLSLTHTLSLHQTTESLCNSQNCREPPYSTKICQGWSLHTRYPGLTYLVALLAAHRERERERESVRERERERARERERDALQMLFDVASTRPQGGTRSTISGFRFPLWQRRIRLCQSRKGSNSGSGMCPAPRASVLLA